MCTLKKSLVGLLLFLFVAFIYYNASVHYLSDGSYAFLMDEAILHHGTPNMLSYQVPRGGPPYYINPGGYLWTLEMVRGRLLYVYPWGLALLSVPAVAAFNAIGLSAGPNGSYSKTNETYMQTIVTTLLSAFAVWLLFDAAASLLSLGWSVTLALSAAFGTQLWSIISRVLWPQTWYLVLVSLAIWLILKSRPQPVLLDTLLAWSVFTRPQGAPIAVMIALYLLIDLGWRYFIAYSLAAVAWGLLFASMMLFFFGQLYSPAYQGSLDFPHEFVLRLEGVLLSPSRGLFIFEPIVLMVLFLTVRYWSALPRRRLAVLALAAVMSHIALAASWPYWWGGPSYGPRLLAETIPWFFLLAVLSLRAFLDDPRLTIHECSAVTTIAILLVAVSVAMNTVGAVSWSAANWGNSPPVDSHSGRLWDWQHPQFLAWAQGG